jgi:hypothetical protein
MEHFQSAVSYNLPRFVHASMVAEWGGIYNKLGNSPQAHRREVHSRLCSFKEELPFSGEMGSKRRSGETPQEFAVNV